MGGVEIETKILKAYFSKSSSGSYTPRVNFPKSWFDKLNITNEDRDIEITLDEETGEIRVRKAK